MIDTAWAIAQTIALFGSSDQQTDWGTVDITLRNTASAHFQVQFRDASGTPSKFFNPLFTTAVFTKGHATGVLGRVEYAFSFAGTHRGSDYVTINGRGTVEYQGVAAGDAVTNLVQPKSGRSTAGTIVETSGPIVVTVSFNGTSTATGTYTVGLLTRQFLINPDTGEVTFPRGNGWDPHRLPLPREPSAVGVPRSAGRPFRQRRARSSGPPRGGERVGGGTETLSEERENRCNMGYNPPPEAAREDDLCPSTGSAQAFRDDSPACAPGRAAWRGREAGDGGEGLRFFLDAFGGWSVLCRQRDSLQGRLESSTVGAGFGTAETGPVRCSRSDDNRATKWWMSSPAS